MPNLRKIRNSWACVALATLASLSHAAFTTTTSQSQFMAAAPVSGTDSFDSLAAGELPGSLSLSAGGFSYVASSASGLYGAGTSDRWLSNADRRDAISFGGFGQTVLSIGATFFGTNEGGAALADQTLTITVTDVLLNQMTTTLTVNSSASFFGIHSTVPLLSLTVAVDGDNLLAAWPTVDDLTLAVPEPASSALLAAGLLAVGCMARRRAAR